MHIKMQTAGAQLKMIDPVPPAPSVFISQLPGVDAPTSPTLMGLVNLVNFKRAKS